MITDRQRRSLLLKRISRIPSDKLKELDEYVSKLEDQDKRDSNNISYAGAWKDIDDSVFESFTTLLIENRSRNRKRINE